MKMDKEPIHGVLLWSVEITFKMFKTCHKKMYKLVNMRRKTNKDIRSFGVTILGLLTILLFLFNDPSTP